MIGRRRRLDALSRLFLAVAVVACFLGGCASSMKIDEAPARDEVLERFNRSGRQAFEQGNFEQAAAFYRKALDRAIVRDDFEAISNARYNLAACLANQRSFKEALTVIQEAQTEMALRDRPVQADFLLLEATVRFHQKDTDRAYAVTDKILAADAGGSSLTKSKTFYLRGLMAAQRGNTGKLRGALDSLGHPEQPQLRADRHELEGHLAMAEKRWKAAIGAFDDAAAFRREDLDYGKMTEALALAAGACEQAGQLQEASKRYLRAGISASLQGEHRKARRWLKQAEKAAAAGGDRLAAELARSHLENLPPD